MPPHLKNWVNVADGSTLRVTVSGDVPARGDSQSEKHDVLSDTGDVTDAQLRAGYRARVRSKKTVSLIVFLTFVENVTRTGRIEARVVRSDGSVHGQPFAKDFTGKAGDPEVFAFFSARGL